MSQQWNKLDNQLDGLLAQLSSSEENPVLHQPLDDGVRRRVIIGAVSRVSAKEQSVGRRAGKMALVAAALMLALGVVAFFGSGRFGVAPPVGPKTSSVATGAAEAELVPGSRFALLHGAVQRDDGGQVVLGAPVPVGQWIETVRGSGALALPGGIGVGMGDNTAVRVTVQKVGSLGVEVNRGVTLFSVDPDVARAGFTVRVPFGELAVKGTLFSVMVDEEGRARVLLHKGALTVSSLGNGAATSTILISKGEEVSIGANGLERSALRANRVVTEQMIALGCIDNGELFSELDMNNCQADGQDGASAARLQGGRPAARPVTGTRVRKPVIGPTLDELLKEARAARLSGRYAISATLLEEVVRRYGNTRDGRTALVSLGQLELSRLGRPQSALNRFDAYLKNGGPLLLEALNGKARAYRALGEVAGEKAVLLRLVKLFPDGPAARAANARLAILP